MRALTFRGVTEIRLETVPDPDLRSRDDAIVQVERAGLCGSGATNSSGTGEMLKREPV